MNINTSKNSTTIIKNIRLLFYKNETLEENTLEKRAFSKTILSYNSSSLNETKIISVLFLSSFFYYSLLKIIPNAFDHINNEQLNYPTSLNFSNNLSKLNQNILQTPLLSSTE